VAGIAVSVRETHDYRFQVFDLIELVEQLVPPV
jgi:hypothetical protein